MTTADMFGELDEFRAHAELRAPPSCARRRAAAEAAAKLFHTQAVKVTP